MTRSLAFRITAAILAVSLVSTALVAIVSSRFMAREFGFFMFQRNHQDTALRLADHYRLHGGWLENPPALMAEGLTGSARMVAMGLADADGWVIVEAGRFRPGMTVPENIRARGTAIEVDGEMVGTLFTSAPSPPPIGNPAALAFLGRVNRAMALLAGGVVLAAIALGWMLSRPLTRPLRELTTAAGAIASGNLAQKVSVPQQRELGALAAAFNRMSTDLADSRDRRQKLTADIAHELRTPLSVILGHTEAMRDGIVTPGPETLALVHDEALRLNRMVTDMRTLSLAEAGELNLEREATPPAQLLQRVVSAHAPRAAEKEISLTLQRSERLPIIEVDADRITQVLHILLENALRHTPTGGSVTVSADTPNTRAMRIVVNDSGLGIGPEELPHLFERFYRGDRARARRKHGGSGLGLAIARSLVQAHGGDISVESQPGHGTAFAITLPTGA